MHVQRKDMEENLKKQEKELTAEITSLNKKVGYMSISLLSLSCVSVEIFGEAI